MMKYPKKSFSYPCFQVDFFKELVREFQVKGIDENLTEHDISFMDCDIESM